jgi:hypothetical protein
MNFCEKTAIETGPVEEILEFHVKKGEIYLPQGYGTYAPME